MVLYFLIFFYSKNIMYHGLLCTHSQTKGVKGIAKIK